MQIMWQGNWSCYAKINTMKYLIICLTLAGLTACHNAAPGSKSTTDGQATATTPTSGQLKDTAALNDTSIAGEWQLQPQLASDTASGRIPHISFDVAINTFSGNTGCNSMRGTYVKSGDSLVFNKQLITTKMACIGYNENTFLNNLFRVNHYTIKNGVLQFMENENVLFKWERHAQPVIKKA